MSSRPAYVQNAAGLHGSVGIVTASRYFGSGEKTVHMVIGQAEESMN
jgi:hypothetical protein